MPDTFEPVKETATGIKLPEGAALRFLSPPGAFRLQLNDVDQAGDGGRVALVADNTEGDDTMTEDMKISAATVVLNFRKDGPMRDYPVPARDGGKRYTVVIIEHDPEV